MGYATVNSKENTMAKYLLLKHYRGIHEWLEVRPFLTAPPTITE
jgi:hypothetical protein